MSTYKPKEEPTDYVMISEAEFTFLYCALKFYPDKLASFRQTCKVHKRLLKMRPIICCAGTFMNYWSRWLDYWLQKLKPLIPSYLKSGDQLLEVVISLHIPSWAYLVVSYATAMYNNIDTKHTITVITWWLKDLCDRELLPEGFPLDVVLSAMVTITRNNIFEFGDLYFLQLLGTAMCTSAAVMWETLYYAYHEIHTLLPKHGTNLLYYNLTYHH